MDKTLLVAMIVIVVILVGVSIFLYKKQELYIPMGSTGAFSISSDSNFESQLGQKNLSVNVVNVDSSGNLYSDYGVPPGTIVMWTGSSAPSGWAICDGTQGTPDLRSRFVVGATIGQSSGVQLTGSSISTNNTVFPPGYYGGEEYHTLTVDEMPSHSHNIPTSTDQVSGVSAYYGGDTGKGYLTDATGGSQPHNNMPPFYALLFIMKLTPTSS